MRTRAFARTVLIPASLFLAGLAGGQLSAQSPLSVTPGVSVRQSDGRTLIVEFRPIFRREQISSQDGQQSVLFDFDGAVRLAPAGSADLRSTIIPVALPSAAGNSVQIIASDYEDVPNADYAPVPVYEDRESMPVAMKYERNPEAYRRERIDPSTIVELLPPTRARTVVIGRVRVSPIQYDAARRVVRKYSRLLIQVDFGVPGQGAFSSTDDPLIRGSVVNGSALASWKGRTPLRKTSGIVPSILGTGEWYRMTVAEDGLYRLDAKYLAAAGINLSAIDPRTIKIYGNGGREVPEDPTAPRISDLSENAIYVEGEGDGKFDQADGVLFYGRSTRGVVFDGSAHTLRHYVHSYAEGNYYWLTFGGSNGKRMAQIPSSGSAPDVVAEAFTDLVAIEEEKVNLISSGRRWFGQTLNGPSGSFTYMNLLPDLVPNGTITYRYSLALHSDVSASFVVREGTNIIGNHLLSASSGYLYGTTATLQRTGSSSLPGNTSQLNFALSGIASSQGWIDWVEILFPRRLWAVNSALRFRAPDSTGMVEYRLQQFSSMPLVLDVTVHDDVKIMSGISGSYVFRRAEVRGTASEYFASTSAAWKTPAGITRTQNQDIRGYADGADFIIVTSEEFRAAADRLKAHREQAQFGGLKTYVADVARIYNEFGGGLQDISAIRDFLKYAYENWSPRPQFVLLLGGASYDYKGILGTRSTFVPIWQSPESLDEIYSYCTDDFFAKFDALGTISMVLGRIPSRTPSEGDVAIDKTIRYDAQSARDPWKMRILFVGDDAYTADGGEIGDRTTHSQDAEDLATRFTPDEIEKKKIYIAEYPLVNTGAGRRRPAANQAIIDQVNQGVLIFNYSGHGRADLLSHEHIFEVQTAVPQMNNADRLSVWFLATCGFSQFDDPKSYTGSEFLMNRPDGAAVAVVSATRKVYQGANAALNQGMYLRMFSRGPFGRLTVERPATALFLYKVASGDSDPNDLKYVFMGDPTMRLQYPSLHAMIDSINGERVDSLGGSPRTTPVQLRSLSQISVSGTVRGTQNDVDPAFGGRTTMIMNDATRLQTIVNFYPGANWSYVATGGTIFRGENTVLNGRFRSTFIVPKDVSYSDSTTRGRLVAYLSGAGADGVAFTSNVRVAGADSAARNDGHGPLIDIYLNSRDFRPGDMIYENPVLYVDLRDSNGINTSGTGIGHRIEAWVNGSLQSKDLTDYYSSKLDNYREGTVQYLLKDLPQGRNSLRVRAWDSFNNSSSGETFFTVASGDGLTLADVLNFPNPFSDATLFTFRQNQSTPLNVTIKIFTVAGRLIQTIDSMTNGEPYIRIPWDGRDRDGDRIANGVYLYKVIARTPDARFTSEALGKISVLK